MRVRPASLAFTILLGLLAAIPSFGIDMSLTALAATGAALGVPASEAGLTISVFMVSLAATPLVSGPASDRYGRKPVIILGCTVFVAASLGCALAQSLPALLIWRLVQGAGAGAASMALPIIRDLFDEDAARARISSVVVTIHVVPMIAPTLGAALLALGGWRLIYAALVAVGLFLLSAMSFGFTESVTIYKASSMRPGAIVRNYLRILRHPICLGYILVSAAAFAAVFAYAAGSSLFFIIAEGLHPGQYGMIFGASAVAVMTGAFLGDRLSRRGISSSCTLIAGFALSTTAATSLLQLAVVGWTPLPLAIALVMAFALAFGLIAPNVMNHVMQPLPHIAGAAGAAAGAIQTLAGACSSGLAAVLFDGHSALSMALVMASCSLAAAAFYFMVVTPAEGREQSNSLATKRPASGL